MVVEIIIVMITEYIVEDVNFIVLVPVDEDLCGCPYMEAATITLEHAFRPFTKPPTGYRILTRRTIAPGIGAKLFVCKNGDIGDDKKTKVFNFIDVARNAGMMELVRHLERV